MGVITFLKKRYKEHLNTKLDELKKLSSEYCSTIDSYDESISQQSQISTLNIPSFFSSYCNNYYYTEELTMQYDFYYYYTSLYNRTVAKIERLESLIKKL